MGTVNAALDWLPPAKLAILGGMMARTFPWERLPTALEMEAAGKSAQKIWQDYGSLSPLKEGPRLYFEIAGTDQSTWKVIPSSDPSIVEGYDSYPEAAADYLNDFRNQFIRR